MLSAYVSCAVVAPLELSTEQYSSPWTIWYGLSSFPLCLKVAITWFVSQLAGLAAADPSTMHLMDVASGYCLQTGVTGATGGLTLQPQCNVPNDSKVHLLSFCPDHASCKTAKPQYNDYMTARRKAQALASLFIALQQPSDSCIASSNSSADSCRSGN